eukprot:12069579-Alexandrium_andersonii.AAC.1
MLNECLERREAEVREYEGGPPDPTWEIPRGARWRNEKFCRMRRWGDAWVKTHGDTDPVHPSKLP